MESVTGNIDDVEAQEVDIEPRKGQYKLVLEKTIPPKTHATPWKVGCGTQ